VANIANARHEKPPFETLASLAPQGEDFFETTTSCLKEAPFDARFQPSQPKRLLRRSRLALAQGRLAVSKDDVSSESPISEAEY
jgi:hypothetical protein